MQHSSDALEAYYTQERATLAQEPVVRAELLALGVVRMVAHYDGVGDSGQLNTVHFLDANGQLCLEALDSGLRQRVEDLLYALLDLRHGGWENDEGGSGSFCWQMTSGSLRHVHHQHYLESDTYEHDGFDARGVL